MYRERDQDIEAQLSDSENQPGNRPHRSDAAGRGADSEEGAQPAAAVKPARRAMSRLPALNKRTAIAAAVATSPGAFIVTLGGASVGDHDLVKPALGRLGLELSVETVSVRPGKPTWFGVLGDGRRVLGLPGNPASALVCAELFLRPLLATMQGGEPGPNLTSARLKGPMPANSGREHWARARLSSSDGALWAEPMGDQDSSLVKVFAESGALIRRRIGAPAGGVGDVVDVLVLDRL